MRPVNTMSIALALPTARQPLRAAGAQDDAQLDFRLSELGGIGGHQDVAHHGQLAAPPSAYPATAAITGLRMRFKVSQLRVMIVGAVHVHVGPILHRADIGAPPRRPFRCP